MKVKIMIVPETEKELEEALAFVKDRKPIGNTKQKHFSTQDNVCSKCGKEISKKVEEYSQNKFSRVLCYECQKEEG